ncbi:MAG: DUF4349 domain-containing protein [Polyangiaceae bacterium]
MTPARSSGIRLAALLAIAAAPWLVGCQKDSSPSGAAPAANAAPATQAAESRLPEVARQVIKRAQVRISVASPAAAQSKTLELAKQQGGYVVSSEQAGSAGEAGPESVHVELRVPAARFEATLAALRGLGSHVGAESVSSEDVTEEFVDLEARLKTQRKLEERYLAILDKAATVKDTLEVEKQLADVRGQIEKLEGRQKYLKSHVSLSTINVTFERERPLVTASTSAITSAGKRAWIDAINVSGGIVVGGVRLAGYLIPVLLLVILPLVLLVRFGVQRVSHRQTRAA